MAELENQEVFLPEAVRRASARAEELSQQLHTPPGPSAGDPPPATTVPVEAQLELLPPAQLPASAPPPGAEWEQRYRTLQGKYDNEVPALRAQLVAMEQLVRSMQNAPAETPPAARTQQPPPTPVTIPQEDIDAYGPELIEAQQRWTEAYFRPQLDELRNTVSELRGGQTQIAVRSARDTVHQGLDADPELAGAWRSLNTNPEFMGWLRQPDPLSGHQRYELLQDAYNGGDAMRAGRFFKSFIAEHTARTTTNPPPPPVPTHTGPGQPYTNGHAAEPAGGPRLEDLVAPGRATGSAPNGSGAPEKRIWTNTEISKFFDDRRRGRYSGRDAESVQIEADIFAAANEGRVRR